VVVGRVGPVAVAHERRVPTVDAPAVTQDDLVDRLLVEQRGEGLLRRHRATTPTR
jgi:hypothetical protein